MAQRALFCCWGSMQADSQIPRDGKTMKLPPLPAGLETEIRLRLAYLEQFHAGKGHVLIRVDLAPGRPAKASVDVGGSWQEGRDS